MTVFIHFLIAVVTDTCDHSYNDTYSGIQIQFFPCYKGADFKEQKRYQVGDTFGK